jgi:hypothetical protein
MKTALLIILLSLSASALDPVRAVMQAQQKPMPCYNLVSLNDSTGKAYCYVCKSDTMRISMKRTAISKSELERIYKTVEWLDTLR